MKRNNMYNPILANLKVGSTYVNLFLTLFIAVGFFSCLPEEVIQVSNYFNNVSIVTGSITTYTSTTATVNATITSSKTIKVVRGVCWSKSQKPTVKSAFKLVDSGTGVGSFITNLTNLNPSTTYYVRAYATNSLDSTLYGNEVLFNTLSVVGLPILTTTIASSITATSASTGGNISSDGGYSITARGVCWSTLPNPIITDSTKTTNGTGTGLFTSSISGLKAGTIYYVRAYATNSRGTAYGNEISFTSATGTGLATLTTTTPTSVTSTTAAGGGNITSDGGLIVTARGICWSTATNPTTALSTRTSDGTGMGIFSSSITGLTANTTYYVRAYATNSAGIVYGNQVSFTTTALSVALATVSTTAISTILTTSAVGGGNITNDGGATVTVKGVCWGTTANPTTANSKTTDGIGTGTFTSSITGLTENTTYYVRAYATNSVGTAYGTQVSFSTITLPSLTTTIATSITNTTASSGGNITSDGGSTVTARGVCWSTTPNPTTALTTKTLNGTGIGSFTSSITGLIAGTTYYVRAYATNSAGTNYGVQVNFTTTPAITLPTVSTTPISAITQTTAKSGGNITNDGGATVTERGVCWNTSSNPTIGNVYTHTSDGTGTGTFSSSITGLVSNTTYYVRTYATNSAGTVYGNEVSFTTTQILSLPTVTTNAASAITSSSATGGGNVTSDGGATVTARGVCWSTSSTPTISNSKTTDGTGIGAFTSLITGLSATTTYYVRAYAVNILGTAYGNQVSFTTSAATVTDIDGNIYHTVTIGTQVWMVENLKTTKYRDGTAIPNVTGSTAWAALTTGAQCDYNNTASNSTTYGKLYNWYTVGDSRNIAPTGWHVPTDAEWTTLTDYLGGESVAGGKLKEAGTAHWLSPNTGATNETGFSALPGGYRGNYGGTFDNLGSDGSWWSATEYNTSFAWYRRMYSADSGVYRDNFYYKTNGFSVRCVRDY